MTYLPIDWSIPVTVTFIDNELIFRFLHWLDCWMCLLLLIFYNCIWTFVEAGGIVTDAAGNPLDFSKGKFLDVVSGIIVTNQKLMPSLLSAVKEALNEKASSLWFPLSLFTLWSAHYMGPSPQCFIFPSSSDEVNTLLEILWFPLCSRFLLLVFFQLLFSFPVIYFSVSLIFFQWTEIFV